MGQRAVRRQPVAQRLALDERHHVEEQPVRLAGIEQRQDVRVTAAVPRCWISRRKRSLPTACGELGTQHLDRHLAAVPEVLGEVDRGHAAVAEFALDAVAVGEACPEALEVTVRIRGVAVPKGPPGGVQELGA